MEVCPPSDGDVRTSHDGFGEKPGAEDTPDYPIVISVCNEQGTLPVLGCETE